jgi:hypothetical protein
MTETAPIVPGPTPDSNEPEAAPDPESRAARTWLLLAGVIVAVGTALYLWLVPSLGDWAILVAAIAWAIGLVAARHRAAARGWSTLRRVPQIVALGLTALLLGGGIVWAAIPHPTILRAAHDECFPEHGKGNPNPGPRPTDPALTGLLDSLPSPVEMHELLYHDIEDGDHTLTIDMKGEDAGSGWATVEDVACVLGRIGAPQSVIAEMERTRALDGRQTATWGHLTSAWTYHPDDGLDVIITER